VLRKRLDERTVVEFADDSRRDAETFEPGIKRASVGAAVGRHEQRRILQAARKVLVQALGKRRRREEPELRFAEKVTERLDRCIGGHCTCGEYEIESMCRQILEQHGQRPLVADHVKPPIAGEQRLEHAPGDELGYCIGNTDGHLSTAARPRTAQHGGEFQTLRKDFFGVSEGDTTELRGDEAATLLFEQRALKLIFEQLDLSADRLWSDVQGRSRGRDTALAHHGPEVEQVGVVEMSHDGPVSSVKAKDQSRIIDFPEIIRRGSLPCMGSPASWQNIGRHALLPEARHDEIARLDVIAHLNAYVAERLGPKVREAWDNRASGDWRTRHGREAVDRYEVAEAMANEPAYQVYSLVRRNTMEYRQLVGRQIVGRQAETLRDRARALNASGDTLRLDPAFRPPRYVSAVEQHLMRGGYTAELLEDDVSNPANYDAGLYATIGGSGGPWSNAAGRALVDWLRREYPAFVPQRILDLGCGLGHNTLPLREAFPRAQIVAIDAAAPMLRYGHARARSLGVDDIEFVQGDAADTQLPSGSFDLVFTTMVLHETSRQALPKIFAEAHRLLRAGGLTIHLEQPTYRGLEPFEQFMRDWDGRFNNEPFWSALHESDLPAMLERVGFGRDEVFETRCVAPAWQCSERQEDFGRAPAWYAVGAWRAANGIAAIG